jgi:hypothetical protein
MSKKHIGSTLRSFLEEMDVREETQPRFLRNLARRSRALREALSPRREMRALVAVAEEALHSREASLPIARR